MKIKVESLRYGDTNILTFLKYINDVSNMTGSQIYGNTGGKECNVW